MWAKLQEKREALEMWARHLDHVVLKGQGKVIAAAAIRTQRSYEGWTAWSGVGRAAKRQETWAERRARLEAEGRDLVAEHRKRQARRRKKPTKGSRQAV
jgi:hypothetical protein